MEAVFQQTIHEARERGHTVLLSSHILAQVEALSDRISIIRTGRAVESGPLEQMRHVTRTTFELSTDGVAVLRGLEAVRHLRTAHGRVVFEADGEQIPEVMRAGRDAGGLDRRASADVGAAAAAALRAGRRSRVRGGGEHPMRTTVPALLSAVVAAAAVVGGMRHVSAEEPRGRAEAVLSVFGHLAEVPLEDFDPVPFWTLSAAGVLGIVLGVLGFRRREIAG